MLQSTSLIALYNILLPVDFYEMLSWEKSLRTDT